MPDWSQAVCRPNEPAIDDDGHVYTDVDGRPLMVPRTDEFFHDARGKLDIDGAKAKCAVCPLTGIGGRCLDFVMDNEQGAYQGWRSGVAGGFSPKERNQLALEHPRYALHPTEPSELEVDVIVREMTDGRDQSTEGGEGEGGAVHFVRGRGRHSGVHAGGHHGGN